MFISMATGGVSPSKGEEEGQWTLNNLEISKKQRNKERWTDQDEDFLLRSENEYEERQMHDLISDSDESICPDLSHYKSREWVNNFGGDELQSSLARINKCVHSMHDGETRRNQERHNDRRQVNSSREPRRKRADVDRQMLQLQNTLRHLEDIVTHDTPKKRDNVFREQGARRHFDDTKLRKLAEAERLVQLLNNLMASIRDEEVHDEPHNLELQELFSQPNHRGERNTPSKNLNSKLNIQNAVGRRPKDNVRQDVNEFCPENSKIPCQLGSVAVQQLRRQMEQLSALCTAPYAAPAPPPPPPSEKEDLLLCLSQCYHTIYMQQMEIQHLRNTRGTHAEECWGGRQRRTQEETLNNQVRQPAARANNFLDNFRSSSRHNLLLEGRGRIRPQQPPDRPQPNPRHKRANATGVKTSAQDSIRNGDDFFVGLYRAARSLKGAEQRHRAIHMLKEMAAEGGGRAHSESPWMNQLPTAAIPPLSKGPYYEPQPWDQTVSSVLLDVQGVCPSGSSPAFWSSLCAYVVSRARAHSAAPLAALRAQLTARVLPAFSGHKYADCEAEFLKFISDLLYDTLADYTEEEAEDKTRELSLSIPPQDVFLQPQAEWGADLAEADQSPSHPEQEDAAVEQEDAPEEDPLPLEGAAAAASNQESEKQKD